MRCHSGWSFCSSTGISGLTAKDTNGLLLRLLLRLLLYFVLITYRDLSTNPAIAKSDIMLIDMQQLNAALDRMLQTLVRKRGCVALRTSTKLAIQFIPRYDHPNRSGTLLKLYQHLCLQAGSTGFLPLKLTLLNHVDPPF